MDSSLHRTWDDVPCDPDPAVDLGYEHDPLTVVRVDEDGEKYIILPGEEEHLSDSEFMIATPESVRQLEDHR